MRLKLILLFLFPIYCKGQDECVLHFYRLKDYGLFNQFAKIRINGVVRLGLIIDSYDTVHIKANSVSIETSGDDFKIDPVKRTEYFFQVQYKPSIFMGFGKFLIVQVDEEYFKKRINSSHLRNGKKFHQKDY